MLCASSGAPSRPRMAQNVEMILEEAEGRELTQSPLLKLSEDRLLESGGAREQLGVRV